MCVAHLQPLGVLIEHRIDDVDEGFVAREEPVPAGQQVSLQPALALVLAEHLHHPAVRREVVVFRVDVGHVAAVGHLKHVLPAVRVVLVGAEQAQVLAVQVLLHDVPEKPAHLAGRFGVDCPRAGHFDGIVAEVRHLQVSEQQAAVGVRVVAHPPVALRSQFGEFGLEPPLGVEQLFGPVALHPLFEDANVLGLVHVAHRHLVAAPVVLALLAVDLRRAGPALRRAEDDHRPGRPLHDALGAGVGPDLLDLCHHRVEHSSQLLLDRRRVVSLDEVRLVAHALEELPQFVVRDAGEEAGVGDLVAVQMEDRQHAAVAGRVEELVALPAGGERAGLGLAVADDAGDDQVRVVERGAVGVAQGVPKLAALVNAARRLGGDMAGDAAREAELLEQLPHPLRVLADLRVDLAVGPFEVGVGHQRRAAVPRADDVDHVQVIALDDPVQVDAEHVQARRRAPVARAAAA